MKKTRIGFVGVGVISGIYLDNITGVFRDLEVAGVCDLIPERAQAAQDKYGVHIYKDMYELFADPTVDIVLNITRPNEHYAVTKAALEAGKHVYSEKPLAVDLSHGIELVKLAEQKGLYLGGAPDTFLGAGIQTARKLIDDGFIGTPIAVDAHMQSNGPESWHPGPAFLYHKGAGPMLDMGPYYVTALVNLIGRVKSVTGMNRITFPQRPITSQPLFGEIINVEMPTLVEGVLEFENGAIGHLCTTFDVTTGEHSHLEIFGSEGTLRVPDPNYFGGDVLLLRKDDTEFRKIPLLFDYKDNSRALGLCEMASAIQAGRPARARCMQQLHVLEIMLSILKAGETRQFIEIQSPFERMPAFEYGTLHGVID